MLKITSIYDPEEPKIKKENEVVAQPIQVKVKTSINHKPSIDHSLPSPNVKLIEINKMFDPLNNRLKRPSNHSIQKEILNKNAQSMHILISKYKCMFLKFNFDSDLLHI